MKKIILALGMFFAIANTNAQTTAQTDLNIMTFNIRFDTKKDGTNSWEYRKENAVNMVRFNEVDILGMQEVLVHQLKDFTKNLKNYKAIGVGREDGKKKGEYSPILYNKNKFTLIKSGCFWLSETPEKPSKGWDAACKRTASWAQLEDKATGKKIFVLNTHLDHRGLVARQESVNLIKTKITELSEGMPKIMMGDFNATADAAPIRSLLKTDDSLGLLDSKKIASLVYGPNWSVHSFGQTPLKERQLIDYILVTKEITVDKYAVFAETLNDTFLSDHAPVFIKISL